MLSFTVARKSNAKMLGGAAGVSEVGGIRKLSRRGERRGFVATVSAPKQHGEAHGAEEEQRGASLRAASQRLAPPKG